MPYRMRKQATIDRDTASPDSIEATHSYLTQSLLEMADARGLALEWSSYRTYVRTKRRGDLVITAWAKVMR